MKTFHYQPSEGSRTDAGIRLPVLIVVLGTLLVLGILLFMWIDLSRTKDTHQKLQAENQQLRTELETAIGSVQKSSSTQSNKQASQVAQKKTEPKKPESTTLVLQKTDVRQVEGGLVASMSFMPSGKDKLDMVALVVRLPRDSGARISDLKQTGKNVLSNAKARVDTSGKFAIIQGTPADLKAINFDLTVTAPVTATVRGSTGIKPFEIKIGLDASNVREL